MSSREWRSEIWECSTNSALEGALRSQHELELHVRLRVRDLLQALRPARHSRVLLRPNAASYQPGVASVAQPNAARRASAAVLPRRSITIAASGFVAARESTLRDLGGLMLEMYKRNRFREELLLDKCEEVLAIEVEIAHVDQRLFQLAPPTGSGQRPIGRCECGVPILPGQNFCGVCGRSFGTLTQARNCAACGTGLRAADAFCPTCGTASPSLLDSHIPAAPGGHAIEAAATATRAADTMIINMPADPDMAPPPLLDTSMAMTPPPMTDSLSPGSSNTPPEMITSLLDDDAPPQLTSVPTVAASPAPATTTATTTAPASVAATETAIDVAVATASTSTPGAAALTPAAEAVPAGRAARKDAKRRMKATEAARRDRAKARARAKMKQAKRGGPES